MSLRYRTALRRSAPTHHFVLNHPSVLLRRRSYDSGRVVVDQTPSWGRVMRSARCLRGRKEGVSAPVPTLAGGMHVRCKSVDEDAGPSINAKVCTHLTIVPSICRCRSLLIFRPSCPHVSHVYGRMDSIAL